MKLNHQNRSRRWKSRRRGFFGDVCLRSDSICSLSILLHTRTLQYFRIQMTSIHKHDDCHILEINLCKGFQLCRDSLRDAICLCYVETPNYVETHYTHKCIICNLFTMDWQISNKFEVICNVLIICKQIANAPKWVVRKLFAIY